MEPGVGRREEQEGVAERRGKEVGSREINTARS